MSKPEKFFSNFDMVFLKLIYYTVFYIYNFKKIINLSWRFLQMKKFFNFTKKAAITMLVLTLTFTNGKSFFSSNHNVKLCGDSPISEVTIK